MTHLNNIIHILFYSTNKPESSCLNHMSNVFPGFCHLFFFLLIFIQVFQQHNISPYTHCRFVTQEKNKLTHIILSLIQRPHQHYNVDDSLPRRFLVSWYWLKHCRSNRLAAVTDTRARPWWHSNTSNLLTLNQYRWIEISHRQTMPISKSATTAMYMRPISDRLRVFASIALVTVHQIINNLVASSTFFNCN